MHSRSLSRSSGNRSWRYGIAAAALAAGMAATAHASGPQPFPPEGSFDRALVNDQAFQNAQGRIAVNAAAGDSNTQSNAAAIAVGTKRTEANVRQSMAPHPGIVTGDAEARIGGQAFQHAKGLISINQAAGSGNAQANAVAIGLGADATVSIETLSTVSATPAAEQPASVDENHHQTTEIGGLAFQSAQGVVQVNQVAGSGNATSNRFSMQVYQP